MSNNRSIHWKIQLDVNSPIEIKVCIIGDTDVGNYPLDIVMVTSQPTPPQPLVLLSYRDVSSLTALNYHYKYGGQERFRSMAPMYYRGAKAAICVFDLTNNTTFDRLNTWIRTMQI